MKRLIAACALLIMCVILVSCKGALPFQKSPGEVVKESYLDANAGRYSEAKALFSIDAQKAIDGDLGQLAGGFKKICDENTRDGTITKVEIVSENIRGEGAEVIANIYFKDGSIKHNDRNSLIKENGSWKITLGE